MNHAVKDIVHGVPPFPLVRETLVKLTQNADAMCISQTPADALQREWAEHHLDGFVKMIAGHQASLV